MKWLQGLKDFSEVTPGGHDGAASQQEGSRFESLGAFFCMQFAPSSYVCVVSTHIEGTGEWS